MAVEKHCSAAKWDIIAAVAAFKASQSELMCGRLVCTPTASSILVACKSGPFFNVRKVPTSFLKYVLEGRAEQEEEVLKRMIYLGKMLLTISLTIGNEGVWCSYFQKKTFHVSMKLMIKEELEYVCSWRETLTDTAYLMHFWWGNRRTKRNIQVKYWSSWTTSMRNSKRIFEICDYGSILRTGRTRIAYPRTTMAETLGDISYISHCTSDSLDNKRK